MSQRPQRPWNSHWQAVIKQMSGNFLFLNEQLTAAPALNKIGKDQQHESLLELQAVSWLRDEGRVNPSVFVLGASSPGPRHSGPSWSLWSGCWIKSTGLSSPYDLCKAGYGIDRKKEEQDCLFEWILAIRSDDAEQWPTWRWCKPGCPVLPSVPPAAWLRSVPRTSNYL